MAEDCAQHAEDRYTQAGHAVALRPNAACLEVALAVVADTVSGVHSE